MNIKPHSEAYTRAIRWIASKIAGAEEPFDWQPDVDLVAHAFQAELADGTPADDYLARDLVSSDVSKKAAEMVMQYVDEFDEMHWYLPRYRKGYSQQDGIW